MLLLRATCLVTPTLTCVLHALPDCRDAKRVEAWIQAVLVDRRYYADDGAQPQSVSACLSWDGGELRQGGTGLEWAGGMVSRSCLCGAAKSAMLVCWCQGKAVEHEC